MLLPERTVDVWIACAIQKAVPTAQFWAPTTNSQASNQPWDLAIGTTAKLLLLEDKGIDDSGNITIRLPQFIRLRQMEIALGSTVFYGLPQPRPSSSTLQWQATFGTTLLVLSPSELGAEVVRQCVAKRPLTAKAKGDPYWSLAPSFLAAISPRRTLNDWLIATAACKHGLALKSAEDLSGATERIDRAAFGELSRDFIDAEIREWDLGVSDSGEERDALRDALVGTAGTRLPNTVLVPI